MMRRVAYSEHWTRLCGHPVPWEVVVSLSWAEHRGTPSAFSSLSSASQRSRPGQNKSGKYQGRS